MSIISFVRPVAAAVALTLGVVPVALAEGGRDEGRGGLVEEGMRGEHQFPMKPADFMKRVEKRIGKTLARLEKMLDKREVPEVVQTQIKKDFEAGAVLIRAKASKAGADGTVTKDEAREVRELAQELKEKAKEKYGHGGRGKGKGKGKNQK